jgi:hypothetical protein
LRACDGSGLTKDLELVLHVLEVFLHGRGEPIQADGLTPVPDT